MLNPGIYSHFSGKLYFVAGVASHKDKEDEQFVVYYPLYQNGPGIFYLSVSEFSENVDHGGKVVPKFEFKCSWLLPNIVPGLRFTDVETFYTSEVVVISGVVQRTHGEFIVEVLEERDNKKVHKVPLRHFLGTTIRFVQ